MCSQDIGTAFDQRPGWNGHQARVSIHHRSSRALCVPGPQVPGTMPVSNARKARIIVFKHFFRRRSSPVRVIPPGLGANTVGPTRVFLHQGRCLPLFPTFLVFYPPVQRFCNEVHVCNLLRGHVGVVPLAGVYLNGACPFGLVYKYMENLDLAQYLKNQPNVGRVKLVTVPYPPPLY